VGAEEFHLALDGVVVGGDQAALAGAEVFSGVEGVSDGVAESADALGLPIRWATRLVRREVGLGRVVDDPEPLAFGEIGVQPAATTMLTVAM
jgi:hypothetical protein